MRQVCISLVCAMALLLAACGSSGSAINGNWTAALSNPDGSTAFTFTATLSESGNGTLNVTNLSFSNSSSCFAAGTTASGTFTATGNTNNVSSGTFQMTVQSGTANANGSNQVALQGTLSSNTITGTWALKGTGSGCTGSGSFTMSKM